MVGVIMQGKKILVIQVAALGYDLWKEYRSAPFWDEIDSKSIETVFPALTCTVQASFRTASLPAEHGMIANGIWDRSLSKAMFWEQSSNLYDGDRIWDTVRSYDFKVGQICWQQSLGRDSDLILSPAPIHKHHGGMIQDFYAKPGNLYNELCAELKSKFNLMNYWGPMTSVKSTKWIANATIEILKDKELAPELLLTYLPHLDYDLQRFGPSDKKRTEKIFKETEQLLEQIYNTAKANGYDVAIFGDYAITDVKGVVYPNKILRDAELFSVRMVRNMWYPDLYSSDAFAMVDHQVAHIYIDDHSRIDEVRALFERQDGIRRVMDHSEIDHMRSGELILEAEDGFWFAYQWWDEAKNAPDYATHVDIHNKPGFDPCELYMSLWPPMSITQDLSKVGGTHGISDPEIAPVYWGATFGDSSEVSTIVEAAKMVQRTIQN